MLGLAALIYLPAVGIEQIVTPPIQRASTLMFLASHEAIGSEFEPRVTSQAYEVLFEVLGQQQLIDFLPQEQALEDFGKFRKIFARHWNMDDLNAALREANAAQTNDVKFVVMNTVAGAIDAPGSETPAGDQHIILTMDIRKPTPGVGLQQIDLALMEGSSSQIAVMVRVLGYYALRAILNSYKEGDFGAGHPPPLDLEAEVSSSFVRGLRKFVGPAPERHFSNLPSKTVKFLKGDALCDSYECADEVAVALTQSMRLGIRNITNNPTN